MPPLPDQIQQRPGHPHGILRDCFQQAVIQLAQGFDSEIDGKQLFSHYQTHYEQSRILRRDLVVLVVAVHKFSEERSDERTEAMKKLISRFYDRSLRFLMYRDWASFESFDVEMLKCDNIPGLLQIAHRFETYLKTLLREVSKRGVLNDNPDTSSQDSEAEAEGAEPRVNL